MATKDNKKRKIPQRKKRVSKPAETEFVNIPAKPFSRKRFVLRLATVAAVVLALVLGMSIFFKVDYSKIAVSGAEKYKVEEIIAASGIRNGENLLTLNKAKISSKIITALPYVKSVRIGVKLPDTILIEIVESEVAYAISGNNDAWWLIDADGKVLAQVSGSEAKNYTLIRGVQIIDPQIGHPAVAEEPEAPTDENGQSVPVTIKGSERLGTVVTILQSMEQCGILGNVATLDVSNMGGIELIYGDRFKVHLGDQSKLLYKIKGVKQVIDQENAYSKGVIDASFTTWKDKVHFVETQE